MNCFVTLNYNDSNNCIKLIENILNFQFFDKVVVVDNNSNKEQLQILKECLPKQSILIENNENKGFAYGNNIGLKFLYKNFNVDFVFICNTDIILNKNIIQNCINQLKKDINLGAITCLMKECDGKEVDSFWNIKKVSYYYKRFFLLKNKIFPIKNKSIKEYKDFFYVDCVRASFVGFRMDMLAKVDFFDEHTFLYYEEDILFTKFKEKNYKVGVLTSNYYIHNHPRKPKSKTNISILKETYKSLYYYLTKYRNINFYRKIIFKIAAFITLCEFKLLNLIRK